MSSEDSSTLKTMALGRAFQLGMLYDLRTDQLIPNISLWNSDPMSNSVHDRSSPSSICEIHTEDTFMKKVDLLGMDAHLKLSVLTGLVKLSRSAKFISNRRTTQHKRRFILKYSITTCLRQFDIIHLTEMHSKQQEMFDPNIATHVVTGILDGIEIYFIFDRILFPDENHANVDRMVMKLLEKMTALRIFDYQQLILDDHEKELAESLTCQYYGDFNLNFHPTTFGEVVKFFRQLPKFLDENKERTVPKQVWIYPLHLLNKSNLRYHTLIHQINNDLVNKSLKLLERLHRVRITINDLRSHLLPTIFLHQTEQQLSMFCVRIDEFETAMRKHMQKLVLEIRGGIKQEIVLANLLTNIDLFAINEKKLENWIGIITQGIGILTGLFNDLDKQVNINISDFSLLQNRNDLNDELVLRLIIHVIPKNEPALDEIFQYLNDNTDEQNDRNINMDRWFNRTNWTLIRNKVTLFTEFATVNRSRENLKFTAEQQYIDDFQMQKAVSIILYQNGVAENFEIPSRPGKAHVTNISYQTVTLNWSMPIYGNQSIQRYKIYGQINTNKQWELLLTTTDAAPCARISNLSIGKHRFKIQGISLAGDTAQSYASNVIDIVEAPPILPDPTPEIVTPPPIVTSTEITTEKAILDVTPAWFEPVKTVSPDKIILPKNYNENSPADVRRYNCLSAYRSMTKKAAKIDFVAEPFISKVDNTETLIVVLNELAHQLGARLTFTHADFGYNDSEYRTACGVTNLGSIHSFLASEGSFETAKFDLHLKLDYDQITVSPETLKKFVLTTINDISAIAQCNKDFIRVFSVKRVASVLLEFGVTTPQHDETIKVADSLKQQLNRISTTKRQDTFQYLFQEHYDYHLEPALAYLQLQQSDLEPRYNRYYPHATTETRGGHPYYHPQGWFRHGLRVIDKYQDDEVWLGMNHSPGEWAVAYHGTKSHGARGIVDQGLLHRFVSADVCKPEAMRQHPGIPDVNGLYVATHCEGGASGYTDSFPVKESSGIMRNYQIVFQCRVQPGKFTEHTGPVRVGTAWRVFDEKAIRPYGLLLKAHK